MFKKYRFLDTEVVIELTPEKAEKMDKIGMILMNYASRGSATEMWIGSQFEGIPERDFDEYCEFCVFLCSFGEKAMTPKDPNRMHTQMFYLVED